MSADWEYMGIIKGADAHAHTHTPPELFFVMHFIGIHVRAITMAIHNTQCAAGEAHAQRLHR